MALASSLLLVPFSLPENKLLDYDSRLDGRYLRQINQMLVEYSLISPVVAVSNCLDSHPTEEL